MAILPTTLIPSSSNIKGGLAGLAATAAVGYLTKLGYLAIAATTLGLPEATMSVLAMGLVATLANVAITHISELKNADDVIKAFQTLSVERTYPVDKDATAGSGNNIVVGGK